MSFTPQTMDVMAAGARFQVDIPMPFDANCCSGASSGGAASTLALAPTTGRRVNISAFLWSYSSAPTGGRLSISDGTNTILDIDITAAGPGSWVPPVPLAGATSATLTVTLAGGGGAVVSKLNLVAYQTPG
jgi:hypothetical protein